MNPLLAMKQFDPMGVDSQIQQNQLQRGQIEAQQQQMAVNQLAIQKDQRGEQRRNQLNMLLSTADQDPTPQHTVNRLMRSGFIEEAKGLQKTMADGLKSASDIKLSESQISNNGAQEQTRRLDAAKKAMDFAGQTAGALLNRPDLTPQMAAQAFANLANDYPGVGDPKALQATIDQMLQADPQSLRALLSQKQMQSLDLAKQIEMRKNQIVTSNTGGKTVTTAVNPYTNESKVIQEVVNTNSPDAILTDGRMRSEGTANRGVAMRGQNMTDARARDLNDTTKSLGITEKELKIKEMQGKAEDRSMAKESKLSAVDAQIGVIDKALNHPGLKASTGLQGRIDPRNYIAGTDSTNFQTVVNQIGGAAFLQAFESLKGGGAITEIEGKKATDAIARLSREQSTKEFKNSLQELKTIMENGALRARGLPPKSAGASGDFGNQPKVSQGGFKILSVE